jgi:hypothetical protein
LDAHLREVARTAIKRRRRTLEILEAHDRKGAASPHPLSRAQRRPPS